MLIRTCVVIVCMLFLGSIRGYSLGLTVTPAEYVLDNLKIGQSYDLSSMAQPFTIKYAGTEKMDMEIVPVMPVTPKQGYEAIPDTSWIKTDKTLYTALPGEAVTVNAILAIPNEEQYFNKKYDVRLRCSLKRREMDGLTGAVPGAEIRVVFSVFGKSASEEEQIKMEEAIQKVRNISITPSEISVTEVPLGKRVDIKKRYNKSIKILNSNDNPVAWSRIDHFGIREI